MSVASLAAAVRAGDLRAMARAISLVEDDHPQAHALLAALHPHTGRAYLVGVTGAPGAGKSTLVDRLAAHLRAGGQTVGILAVDPTSPYTGGALLGDRIRMHRHVLDPGVFIRSMATRGHLGGLAQATADAALVLDAAGRDVVIIETVGVGQDEVEIVRTADVSVVVVVPGTGDDVQALKAGLMEIADVFVVNKADREGADRAVAAIESMLVLDAPHPGAWRPPIVRTTAVSGEGVDALWAAIGAFRAQTSTALEGRRRLRAAHHLREVLGRRFLRHVEDTVLAADAFDTLAADVAARRVDPWAAADAVFARVVSGDPRRDNALAGETRGRLDHVGIATHDAGALARFFREHFGLETSAVERVEAQGVAVRFVESAGARLELLEPLGADTPVGRFLDKRGPGLHHVALAVEHLDDLLRTLAARGVRLVDASPRRGAGGSRVAFVHPSATGGTLVELKERK